MQKTSLIRPAEAKGELTLQTLAMPKDTNGNGDIFGGWLLSQMDLAITILAFRIARGRVATVALSKMEFIKPVQVGSVVSCYCELLNLGRSSITIRVEVWITGGTGDEPAKVTEGEFVTVAIDNNGKPRPVPK